MNVPRAKMQEILMALTFAADRLQMVHKENPNVDYMLHFRNVTFDIAMMLDKDNDE